MSNQLLNPRYDLSPFASMSRDVTTIVVSSWNECMRRAHAGCPFIACSLDFAVVRGV
jgi:hypothetical protein